jgi:hypothetical protein
MNSEGDVAELEGLHVNFLADVSAPVPMSERETVVTAELEVVTDPAQVHVLERESAPGIGYETRPVALSGFAIANAESARDALGHWLVPEPLPVPLVPWTETWTCSLPSALVSYHVRTAGSETD